MDHVAQSIKHAGNVLRGLAQHHERAELLMWPLTWGEGDPEIAGHTILPLPVQALLSSLLLLLLPAPPAQGLSDTAMGCPAAAGLRCLSWHQECKGNTTQAIV